MLLHSAPTAFSITRLLSIIDPFGVATRFTKCRMRIVILCFIPFAAASNMFSVAEYATQDNKVATDTWIKNWRHVQDAGSIAAPLSTFIAMLLINAIVIGILIKRRMLKTSETGQRVGVINSRKWALNIQNKKGNVAVRSHGRDKRTAAAVHLLTASVIMYLISRIPFVTWYVIGQAEKNCLGHLTDDQSVIFLPFYYQFLYANYSINFLIYCGVSREFFARALWMIRHCRRPQTSRLDRHSEHSKSKDTEMTTAPVISAELERALEIQARRESERPIIYDDTLSVSDQSDAASVDHIKQPKTPVKRRDSAESNQDAKRKVKRDLEKGEIQEHEKETVSDWSDEESIERDDQAKKQSQPRESGTNKEGFEKNNAKPKKGDGDLRKGTKQESLNQIASNRNDEQSANRSKRNVDEKPRKQKEDDDKSQQQSSTDRAENRNTNNDVRDGQREDGIAPQNSSEPPRSRAQHPNTVSKEDHRRR
ncbi:myb-like protein X isoform X2 [Paramacrobiotus metropolitanus]|uniref:myb-like protein X isoform X2 n=1 Tax=Paramacrobiotus metropolitanus TaxID=2943436 RepID=UPI0024460BC5|nr:myb-like protein X isoform X2 [Paramacrobiotus metropolitanus]